MLLSLRVSSQPRHAAAWQLFHSEKKDEIGVKCQKWKDAGTTVRKGPALRNEIVREWFNALEVMEKAAWETKADETIAARRKAWETVRTVAIVTDPAQLLE